MAPPLVADRPETSRWLILALVCLAQFMVVLDATITNVALPSIERDLSLSQSDLQWVINGYGLLFGGFLLLGGRAADLFGRKRLFLAGIALFSLASLVCGLSDDPSMLIAARAVQGLGAALVSPAALSIITTTFEGPDRARALGVWAAIAGGGGAFGLLLGGVLTDALSWEWIFFVNVPIGLATLVSSTRFVPESRLADGSGGFDLAGAALGTGGLVLLTYAIVKAGDYGFGDLRTLGLAAGAVALLAGFVRLEARLRAPLVRLGIFRVRSLAASNTAMLLVTGGLFAFFFFGSLYLQQIKGFDPLEAGIAFLPLTGGIILGAGISQALVSRLGIKPVLIGGLLSAALGLLWATQLSPNSSYAGGLLPSLLLIALGMGNVFVPLTLTATANVEADDQGLASGIFNTSQQIGGAIGLAVLSTVSANVTSGSLTSGVDRTAALVDGYTAAFTVGAGLMLGAVVLVSVWLRRRDVATAVSGDVIPVAG